MNEFELKVEGLMRKVLNPLIHENKSVVATKVLKESDDQNRLFKNAGSPYPTPTGRQKKTEFVLWSPEHQIDWRIECKSRKTQSLIGEIIIELNYVANISERVYCLVLNETLNEPYTMNLIKKEIRDRGLFERVWLLPYKDFKKLLKKRCR